MTTTADLSQPAMVSLHGGWFQMGADDGPHPEDGEGPARAVYIDAFEIATTCVTNSEFSQFIKDTGYQTSAESSGSSFVFYQFLTSATTHSLQVTQTPWWRVVDGACWHTPDGPGSSIELKLSHPVTHVSLADAAAYCHWTRTRLPTEAEWEYAARGGLKGKDFPWGDKLESEGVYQANIWQGRFPDRTQDENGCNGTMPVTSYQANNYGLYNTTGNVWEWTKDRFTQLHSAREQRNPKGPLNGNRYVAKGGSYLCHASYCSRYRNSSRQALPADTSTGNLGFRVAI